MVNAEKAACAPNVRAAARLIQNESLPIALRDERRRVGRVVDEYQRAAVARPPLLVRQANERVHQLRIVRRIVCACACIARRIDSRRTVQRINFETRVVRDRRRAAQARGVARLQQRIGQKGCARFRW